MHMQKIYTFLKNTAVSNIKNSVTALRSGLYLMLFSLIKFLKFALFTHLGYVLYVFALLFVVLPPQTGFLQALKGFSFLYVVFVAEGSLYFSLCVSVKPIRNFLQGFMGKEKLDEEFTTAQNIRALLFRAFFPLLFILLIEGPSAYMYFTCKLETADVVVEFVKDVAKQTNCKFTDKDWIFIGERVVEISLAASRPKGCLGLFFEGVLHKIQSWCK